MYKPNVDVRPTSSALAPSNFAAPTYQVTPMEAAFNAASQVIQNSDTPLYGFEQYTPYEMTKRYMSGMGHTGYIGMQSSEDYNAQMQSNWSKAMNGTLKGLGVASTSFIDGTLGTVAGLINMASTGEFHKFFDNPITNKMEDFRNLSEEWAPNYYTDVERNAEWYSTDNWFKTNFLFDKLIKNAGFAAAAIGEGYLVAKLLQKLTRATVLGKLPQAVDELEQGLRAVNQGQKATQVFDNFGGKWLQSYLEKPVANMTQIESMSNQAMKVQKATNSFINKTASVFATTAEANAEALQGYRRIKEDLIQEYKDNNRGEHPTGEALAEIEDRAAQGGNVRFGMNVLTLGISNMIQFPRLLNGAMNAEKGSLLKEINEVVVDKTGAATAKAGEKYVAKSALSSTKQKALNAVASKLGVVQLSEGAEEGMQYAIEQGIHEYEMMAKDPRAMGAIENIFSEGLGKTFNSKEGMESIMLGVLTGGLMNTVTNFGKSGKIKKSTNEFLDQVNNKAPQLKDVIATYNGEEKSFASEMLRSVARGFTAQAEKEEGHKEGDMVKVKDADAKAFMAYALPRIKFGRFDMLNAELDQYKERPFDEVRTELGLPENVTQEDINKRIDGLKEKAQIAKNLYEAMSMRFSQAVIMKDGKAVSKYSDKEIDELVYNAFRVSDYERRFNDLKDQVSDGLSKAMTKGDYGVDALFDKEERLDDQGNEKDLEEIRTQLYKQLDTIDPHLQQDKNGISYAEKLRDLERIQNKREEYLYRFEDLKNQDTMDTNTFDFKKAKVDDYLKYERLSKGKTVMGQLNTNTEKRLKTFQLEDRINKGLEANIPIEDIIEDVKNEDTFLYNETKPQLLTKVNEAITKVEAEAAAKKEQAEEIYTNAIENTDLTDEQFDMAQRQSDQLTAESEALYARVNKLRELQADLENVDIEPTIGTDNASKRKIADNVIEFSDVFLKAAEADPDYGDSRTIDAIESQIAVLKNIITIFKGRADRILNTPEFSGFIAKAEAYVQKLTDLLTTIQSNINDREKLQAQAVVDYYSFMKEGLKSAETELRVILGDKADEMIALLDKAEASVHVDIVYDMIKEKGSPEQQEALVAKLAETEKELIEKFESSEVAKRTPFPDRVYAVSENPRKGIFQFVSMLSNAYSWKETDNALGRFNLKHRNVHQLIRELEAEQDTNQYLYPIKDIIVALKLYNQLASVRFLQDYVNSGDFRLEHVYKTMLRQVNEDKSKGLPTPTAQQILAIREALMYSFLNTDGTVPQQGWIYLEGVIGAGKSSIFGKYYLSMLSVMKGESKDTLIEAVSDTIFTSENINQGLGLTGKRTTEEVIDDLNKDNFKPSFLLIDEMARLSKDSLDRIATAVASFNDRNSKNVKVIGLGDSSQIKSGFNNLTTNTSSEVRQVYTMSVSYRSDVAAISDLQNKFKNNSDPVTDIVSEVSNDNMADPNLAGVVGGRSESAMMDAMKSRPAGSSKMLIVDDGKEAEWQAKLQAQGITGVEVRSAYNAQGQTRDEVFLWLTKNPTETDLDYNTRIYTSARGKRLIYLGNVNVNNKVNSALVELANKNKEANDSRGSELSSKLEKDIDEFEKYLKTTVAATKKQAEKKQEEQKEEEQQEEEQEEEEEVVIKSDSVGTEEQDKSNVVIASKTGKKGFRFQFPMSRAFKRKFWNNTTDPEKAVIKIVPVLKTGSGGKKYIAYVALREIGKGKYVEHATLSNTGTDNEVDGLGLRNDFITRTEDYDNEVYNFVEFDSVSNGVYSIADPRQVDEFTVRTGTIVNGNSLSYKYDYESEPGEFNFKQIVQNWFNSFFDGNNENTFEDVLAASEIKTLSNEDANKANEDLDEFFVEAGRTYIVLDKIDQKNGGTARKQYIELKGRVLTDSYSKMDQVHKDNYIVPVRKFISDIKNFNKTVDKFAEKHADLIEQAQKDDKNNRDFNLGSRLYNRLITLVADNKWDKVRSLKESAVSGPNKEIQTKIDELIAKREEALNNNTPQDAIAVFEQQIAELEATKKDAYKESEIALFDAFFEFLAKDPTVSKMDVVTLAQTIDQQVYDRVSMKQYYYIKDGQEVLVDKDILKANTPEAKAIKDEWIAYWNGSIKEAKTNGRPLTQKDMDGNDVPVMSRRDSAGPVQHILNQLARANNLAGPYWLTTFRHINGKSVIVAPNLLNNKGDNDNNKLTAESELLKYIINGMKLSLKYPNGFSVFLINKNGEKVPYYYGTRYGITRDTLSEEDLAKITTEFKKYQVGNYTFDMLESMFSEDAFTEGKNNFKLRVNVPRKTNWKEEKIVNGQIYTAEEYAQNMLESYFVNVSPSNFEMNVDPVGGSAAGSSETVTTTPPPSNDDSSPSGDSTLDDDYSAMFLKKSKNTIEEGAETIHISKLLEYVKQYIPGITEDQLKTMSSLHLMRALQKYTTDPLYGAFVDGVVMLEQVGNSVYKIAARHEVFHKIFKQFTTPIERQRILNAARQEFKLGEISDYDVEEYLADKWAERRDDKSWLSQISLAISRFFRKVGAIVGFVTQNKNLLESYFDAIEQGYIGKRSEQTFTGFSPKRKFEKDYDNDINLVNDVEKVWLKFMAQRTNIMSRLKSENKTVAIVPQSMREMKLEFVRMGNGIVEKLKQKTDRTTGEEKSLKAFTTILKKNGKGNYSVLNDLIKELFPAINNSDLITDDEVDPEDKEAVANILDLIDKDNNINVYTKLTENVRRFLSTIIITDGNKFEPIRSTNALAKLYRTIESFDTEDINMLKHNLRVKYSENYNVEFDNNGKVISGSPQNVAIFNSLIDVIDQSIMKSAMVTDIKSGKTAKVSLFKNARFLDENTFVYNGHTITRTGAKEAKELEKALKAQQEEEEVDDSAFDNTTLKIEDTLAFYERIATYLRSQEAQYEKLTTDQLVETVSYYWVKSDSLNTFQDLMNLINSLYDVMPHVGLESEKTLTEEGIEGTYEVGGYVGYSLQKARVDKEAVTYESNLVTKVQAFMGTAEWEELHEETSRYNTPSEINKVEMGQKAAVVNAMFKLLKLKADDVIMGPSTIKSAFKATVELVNEAQAKTDKMTDMTEEQKAVFTENQNKRLKILARALSKADNDHTPSTYRRGDGKIQFFQRYIDFAQRTLLKLVRAGKSDFKDKLDDFLTRNFKDDKNNARSSFFKFNFFNPKSGLSINKIHEYGLHDSIKQTATDNVTLFTAENEIDFLKRMFFINFGGMINRRAKDDEKASYGQNYYTISNKSYMKFARVDVLSNKKVREGIKAALKQEFLRPDPDTVEVRNGQEFKPYNIKNYRKNWKKSFLAGVDQAKWSALREKYLASNNRESLESEFEALIDQVMTRMDAKSEEVITRIMAHADSGGMVTNLPLDINMPKQYQRLLDEGLITAEELNKYPEHFSVTKTEDGYTVKMLQFDPKVFTYAYGSKEKARKIHANHIRPMVNLWYKNNYINGLMLNQITVGDQAMFKNEYDEIKRMSIFHGIGQNPTVGENYIKRIRRVIVVEDIISMFDPSKKEDATDYQFQKELEEALGFKINWSDGQGFMTQRSHDALKKGFGPGANLQDIKKPVYGGIDKYGVNRTLKYSSVVISDALANRFPILMQNRIKCELNGLTGADYTRGKELLTKQIRKGLSTKEFNELQKIFAKNEDMHVDELVFSSATKTGIPEERLKFDTDFNKETGNYKQFENDDVLPEGAVIELDNRNWRIQLNPVYEIDAHVPLPTQLVYFANFDGNNKEETASMFTDIAELYSISGNEIADELGLVDKKGRANTHKDKLINLNRKEKREIGRKLVDLIKKKMSAVTGKEKSWEYLSAGVSHNAPFLINDVLSSLSSHFTKKIQKITFPGSKFVLQSAAFTHEKDLSKGVPKYDTETNIMEVYLPNIFRKFLPNDIDFSNEEVFLKDIEIMLGWRIPSTGLNSTARVKVIGFYPSDTNVIIAPPNITFLHGADYDVDSLFVARNSTVTKRQAKSAEKVGLKVGDVIGFSKSKETPGFLADLNEKIKAETDKNTLKGLMNLKKEFLKNRIVNTYLNLLQKKENYDDVSRPITFDAAKSLSDPLSAFNIVAYYSPASTPAFRAMYDLLKEGKADKVDLELLEEERDKILFSGRDLNDAVDIMKMQLDNKAGTKLTGIVANSIKGISYLLQSTENMAITLDTAQHFTIDGFEYSQITNKDKSDKQSQISVTLGWMVNAAIDNVKEQILSVINMNLNTGNLWIGLTAAGVPFHTAVKLMTQSYIVEMAQSKKVTVAALETLLSSIESKIKKMDPEYSKVVRINPVTITSDSLNANIGESFKTDNMTKEELISVANTLALLIKGSQIGEDIFTATQATTFLQENLNGVAEQEGVMEAMFGENGMYESKKASITVDGINVDYNEYAFADSKTYPIRKGFSFTNVNFMKLAHWKSAWIQFRTLYDLQRGLTHKNHEYLDVLSRFIIKKWNIKLDFQDPLNRGKVRDELMKYFLSGLKFKLFNKTMNFSTLEEPAYTLTYGNRIGKEVYGAEAFVQRFIEKVIAAKDKDASNGFLNKIRIDTVNGLYRLSFTDIGGLQIKDAKMLESEFVRIDEDIKKEPMEKVTADIAQKVDALKKEKEEALKTATSENKQFIIDEFDRKIKAEEIRVKEFKYSDFQKDFVKYLAIVEGLRFGSTTFSTLMPADLYRPVFAAFDKFMYDILDPDFRNLTDEQRKVLEEEHKNKLIRLLDNAGLQIAMSMGKDVKVQRLKSDDVSISGRFEEVNGKQVFYNAKVNAPTTEEESEDNEAIITDFYNSQPDIVKVSYFDSVYLMVKVNMVDPRVVYYQLVGKVPSRNMYQFDSMLIDKTYRVADYFNTKISNFTNDRIEVEGTKIKLYHGFDEVNALSVGDVILTRNPGDYTRLLSKQYEVVKVTPADKDFDRKAHSKELKKIESKMIKAKKKDREALFQEKTALLLQEKKSRIQYELLERETEVRLSRKSELDTEALKNLYADFKDFSPEWNEDAVLNFHNTILSGERKVAKSNRFYEKAFQINREELEAKHKDITQDGFMSMSNEEKDNILKCL